MEYIILIVLTTLIILIAIASIKHDNKQRNDVKKLAELWGLNYSIKSSGVPEITGTHNGLRLSVTYPMFGTKIQIKINTSASASLLVGAKNMAREDIPSNLQKFTSDNINVNDYYTFYSDNKIEAEKIIGKIENQLVSNKDLFKNFSSTLYIANDGIEYDVPGMTLTTVQQFAKRLPFIEQISKTIGRYEKDGTGQNVYHYPKPGTGTENAEASSPKETVAGQNKKIPTYNILPYILLALVIYFPGAPLLALLSMDKYRLLSPNDDLVLYALGGSSAIYLIIFLVDPFKKIDRLFEESGQSMWRLKYVLFIPTVALGVAIIIFSNGYLDFSEPATYETTIADKSQSGSGSSKIYTLDFYLPDNELISLESNYNEYNEYEIGSMAKITIKKGFLGSEWIQRMEKMQ